MSSCVAVRDGYRTSSVHGGGRLLRMIGVVAAELLTFLVMRSAPWIVPVANGRRPQLSHEHSDDVDEEESVGEHGDADRTG